eukprot:1157565-Pelagomonas_calceolata.AAC.11
MCVCVVLYSNDPGSTLACMRQLLFCNTSELLVIAVSFTFQSSDKPEQLDLQKKDPSFTGLAAWVGGAAAFGAGIWYFMGRQKAEEFFAGYLLEQSLSVDNLFVFLLVFGYFKTPEAAQGKVLQYGILSAAVLRAVFILGGVELIKTFEPALGVFAGILIFSSVKLLTKTEDEDADEDLADNSLVQLCRRFIKTGDDYDGDNFFTVLKDGTKVATPLLLALAVIELSDVVFAVDSIPAVFGVTLDPFIIYTSNMFAIFSLRALYGFVSTVMTELRFLDKEGKDQKELKVLSCSHYSPCLLTLKFTWGGYGLLRKGRKGPEGVESVLLLTLQSMPAHTQTHMWSIWILAQEFSNDKPMSPIGKGGGGRCPPFLDPPPETFRPFQKEHLDTIWVLGSSSVIWHLWG